MECVLPAPCVYRVGQFPEHRLKHTLEGSYEVYQAALQGMALETLAVSRSSIAAMTASWAPTAFRTASTVSLNMVSTRFCPYVGQ